MTTALDHLAEMGQGDAVLGDNVKLAVRIYETKEEKLAAAAEQGQNRKEARDEWRGEVGWDAHIKVFVPAELTPSKSVKFTNAVSEEQRNDTSARPYASRDTRRPKVIVYTFHHPETNITAWYYHPAAAAYPKTVTVQFVGKRN